MGSRYVHGCERSIENLALAARAFGLAADVQSSIGRLDPSPGPGRVLAARIALGAGQPARDALFDAIPNRPTNETSGISPLMTIAGKLLPDLGTATTDRFWLDNTRDVHTATAPLFGMILVRDRLDMAQAIDAGRAWQRLHLALTAQGLAAQPPESAGKSGRPQSDAGTNRRVRPRSSETGACRWLRVYFRVQARTGRARSAVFAASTAGGRGRRLD